VGRSFPVGTSRVDRSPIVDAVASIVVRTWDRGFDGDIIALARFVVSRAIALARADVDCVISFGRVLLSDVAVLDPNRVAVTSVGGYPTLLERLRSDPAYDSVPLSVGCSRDGTSLWDGHRRLETYRAAGRTDFPAWSASFHRGSGRVVIPTI
jgi:hypothetical protein